MSVQDILSSNKNRAYPFYENSGSGTIPNWLLLDFRLVNTSFSGRSEDSSVVCKSYSVYQDTISIFFAYRTSNVSFDFNVDVERGSDIKVGTVDISSGVSARVAVYGGSLGESSLLVDGSYTVEAEILKTRIVEIDEASKVRSLCGATGSIQIKDGYNTDAKIVDGTVYVTVGKGLGLGSSCGVPEDAFDCSKALLFINGQHADTSGNINIVGGTGIIVQTGRTAMVNGAVVPAITIRHDGSLKEML